MSIEQKANKRKGVIARLLSLLTTMDKVKLSFGAVCLSIASLGNNFMPALIGAAINSALKGTGRSKYLLMPMCAAAASSFVRTYCFSSVNANVKARIRNLLFTSLMKQDVNYHTSLTNAEKVAIVSTDVDNVCDSMFRNITNFFRFSNSAFIMPYFLYRISPRMTRFALIAFPTVGASLALTIIGKTMAQKKLNAHLATTYRSVEEKVANIRTVKLFGQEERESQDFQLDNSEAVKKNQVVALREGLMFGWIGGSVNFIMSQILCFGANEIANNRLDVGELTAFLMYSGFSAAGWAGLGQLFSEHKKTMATGEKLFELIDREPTGELALSPSTHITSTSDSITADIRDVTFTYPPRASSKKTESNQEEEPTVPHKALDNLTFAVGKGECVALVGTSGSGKSTVVSLLTGLILPHAGQVSICGQQLSTVGREDLLDTRIACVEQESQLFDISVFENVRYGCPSATEEDVIEAMKAADCYNFVMEELPEQLQSRIGHLGKNLSLGQRQRLSIARALIKKPQLLLLDESTSALDGASESKVIAGAKALVSSYNGTIITVAHRESVMKQTDKLFVLHKGSVVEEGRYETLVADRDSKLNHVLKNILEQI